jgi:hypothetical protein
VTCGNQKSFAFVKKSYYFLATLLRYSGRSHADNFMCSPVMSHFQPGYLQKLLPESAPDEPEALEDILNGRELLAANGTQFKVLGSTRFIP